MSNQEKAQEWLASAEEGMFVGKITARATISCAYSLLAILEELKQNNNSLNGRKKNV